MTHNELIANAISPEREGWAWKLCGCSKDGYDGEGTPYVGSPYKECETCHGTGRVPVDLADPSQTWRIICWFNGIYAEKAVERNGLVGDKASHSRLRCLGDAWRGIEAEFCNAGLNDEAPNGSSIRIRDLIAAAIEQSKDGKENKP